LAGTDKRVEKEFKFAFKVQDNINIKSISKLITTSLNQILLQNKFTFSKQVEASYFIDKKYNEFIFEDFYFDTKMFDVLSSVSAYRLRYRWNDVQDYYLFQYFDFYSGFYPIRVEILK